MSRSLFKFAAGVGLAALTTTFTPVPARADWNDSDVVRVASLALDRTTSTTAAINLAANWYNGCNRVDGNGWREPCVVYGSALFWLKGMEEGVKWCYRNPGRCG